MSHLLLTLCDGKRLLEFVQVSCLVWLSSVAYVCVTYLLAKKKKKQNKNNLGLQLSVKSFTNS